MDESKFMKAMEIDKKVADGKLRLMLLKVIHRTNTTCACLTPFYRKSPDPAGYLG